MKRSIVTGLLLWTATTGAVTAISWQGVEAVDRAVDGQPAPSLSDPAGTVSASSPLETDHGATPPKARRGTKRVLAPKGTGSTAPSTVQPPPSGSNTSGSSSMPEGPDNSDISQTEAVYSTPGGEVTVRCIASGIDLFATVPSNGYQAQVLDAGPATIRVAFRSAGETFNVTSYCRAGSPQEGEPPKQPSSAAPPAAANPSSAGSRASGGFGPARVQESPTTVLAPSPAARGSGPR